MLRKWYTFKKKKIYLKNKIFIASAGNQTRINCLEGSYADHYTTDACWKCHWNLEKNWILIILVYGKKKLSSGYIYSPVCKQHFYIVLGDQLSPLVIISYPKYKLCLLWMSDNALWLDAVASSLWSLLLKNAARFRILSKVNTVGVLTFFFKYHKVASTNVSRFVTYLLFKHT